MKKLIVLVLFLSACKKPGPLPPPIEKGTCLVDHYVGPQAMKQTCTYVGYSWACTYAEDTKINSCSRGGEASGERLPVVDPRPMSLTPPTPTPTPAPVPVDAPTL